MNKKILVLGGGVAGSSMAYYLTEKGYEVTVIERNSRVGGLARTCYYSGHPYEFGPHIWFWPGGKDDPVNATIVKLTNDELFHIDRRLFTYVEADRRKYRYPVHYQDIDQMPERETIHRELRQNRDEHAEADREPAARARQVQVRRLLHRGDRPDAVPEVHGELHLEDVEHPGRRARDVDGLGRSVPPRLHEDRRRRQRAARAGRLRSDQVRGSHARQRASGSRSIPKGGWNAVWNAMVARSTVDPRPRRRHPRRAQAAVRADGQRREALLRRLPHGVLLDRHRRPLGRGHAALHRPHDDSAADSRARERVSRRAPSRCTTRRASSRRA